MKIITRKISLEPLITRFPVCYPSIKDGVISYIPSDSLDSVMNAHYGYIPLGVSEDVTTAYSNFTDEMGDSYSGKVISCYTLQKWMVEFEQYYDLLRSDDCHGAFESAAEYYERTYPGIYTENIAEDMDDNFKRHGGSAFYGWLIDNYFITLDLRREYESVTGCTYDEWNTYVDNIGCSKMPFPAAVRFFGEMSRMHGLYSEADCKETDDCCECSDYKWFGGDAMYDCISSWMFRIRTNIYSNNRTISLLDYEKIKRLIPKIQLNFTMSEKIEDLGVLVSFSKEFVPGRTYTKGEICDYEGITYIMTNNNNYNKPYFITSDGLTTYWKNYYEVYIEEKAHEDEADVDYQELGIITGRTVSSLDFFVRKEETLDGMGNVLPGYFRPNVESYFVQPAENSLLGFMYQPGIYNNIEELGIEDNTQLYKCDFLEKILFFFKDWNGNVINDTITTATVGDDVNSKIQSCITRANSMSPVKPNDGSIYADFHYCLGSVVTIDDGVVSRIPGCDVKCIDHCTVEETSCQYHMSQTESYPLRYYRVNMDTESHYSDEYQKYEDVDMCDFMIDLSETEGKEHNATPYLRKEELVPFSIEETPVDNIYIDRGYATVLDRHLRIGEITNYEQLEKYGNGIFQIFNSDEELV